MLEQGENASSGIDEGLSLQ